MQYNFPKMRGRGGPGPFDFSKNPSDLVAPFVPPQSGLYLLDGNQKYLKKEFLVGLRLQLAHEM